MQSFRALILAGNRCGRPKARCLVFASLLVLLSPWNAVPTSAQTLWRGRADVEVTVEAEKGDALPGAHVTFRFLEVRPVDGPATLTTDREGKVHAVGLAEGRWHVEVASEGYRSYLASVKIRLGKKVEILSSAVLSEEGSNSGMEVRFSKARKGEIGISLPPAPPPVPEPAPVKTPKVVEKPAPSPPPKPLPIPEEARQVDPEIEPEAELVHEAEVESPDWVEVEPVAEEIPELLGDELNATTPIPSEEPAASPIAEPAEEPSESIPPVAEIEPAPPESLDEPKREQQEQPEPAPELKSLEEPPTSSPPEPPPVVAEKPQPVVAPPMPPVATGPKTALRARSGRGCPDCRPGEQAVTVEASVAASVVSNPCPDDLESRVRKVLELAANEGSESFIGPLLDAATRDLSGQLEQAANDRIRQLLQEVSGTDASCRLLAIVLPRDFRYSGYRYEARDVSGIADCPPSDECRIGACSWQGNPIIVRRGELQVIYGTFSNRSPDRVRHPALTVYFER